MPAPRPLKGARYALDATPRTINIIQNILPYADFAEAHGWYEYFEKTVNAHKEGGPGPGIADLQLLGCNDRYFLLTAGLNRKDAIHPWLYDRCREVEARPDGYLDLWARFHFKSSIITFAGVIQEAIADPEIRIGIFSNTKQISTKFLAQIKHELEANERLKLLYSDVLWENPTKDAPTWSVEKGLTFKRKGNPKEATIEAHGLIEGMPVGRHFPLLVFDDIITQANVTNPEQIQRATLAVQMADNLGDLTCTRKWFIGTRYHFGDTYGQLLKDEVLKPRIWPATKDKTLNAYQKQPDGSEVNNLWLLTPDRWEDILKSQRDTIAAQMLQNPLAGQENLFKAEWLKPYHVRPERMRVYILADPSLGIHATSDRTAIAVIGIDPLFNKFLLDGYCHRMALSERWRALKELYVKWEGMQGVEVVEVGYERYGMQSDLEYFQERMREDPQSPSFTITELNWTRNRQGESKAHRVGRMEPDFRNGSFFVPAQVWYPRARPTPKMAAAIAAGSIAQPKDTSTALWSIGEDGEIHYTMRVQGHPEEHDVVRNDELWRINRPLRRRDEDNHIYDLTRVFFDEYLFFPFSPRDDLVDAMSRIYDMKPTAARRFENVDQKSYPDD